MKDATPYRIGQLADVAGVPVSTVRYYERRGLLTPCDRTEANYRLYDENALDRLRFIKAAQEAGFTLGDIESLLEFQDGRQQSCPDVQALIKRRVKEVGKELEHLQHVQSTLSQWLRMCQRTERTGRCGVLAKLESRDNEISD